VWGIVGLKKLHLVSCVYGGYVYVRTGNFIYGKSSSRIIAYPSRFQTNKDVRNFRVQGGVKSYTFFCDLAQRRLVIPYRHFGTTYRCHLQGSSSPITTQGVQDYLIPADGADRLPRNVRMELRGCADTSLDQHNSRCRRTESIVSSERGVCSCAELQVFSCYRG
jgi:hypothetical protein